MRGLITLVNDNHVAFIHYGLNVNNRPKNRFVDIRWQSTFVKCANTIYWRVKINSAPAGPRYALPLQTG